LTWRPLAASDRVWPHLAHDRRSQHRSQHRTHSAGPARPACPPLGPAVRSGPIAPGHRGSGSGLCRWAASRSAKQVSENAPRRRSVRW